MKFGNEEKKICGGDVVDLQRFFATMFSVLRCTMERGDRSTFFFPLEKKN
jgi:hypothetical protein